MELFYFESVLGMQTFNLLGEKVDFVGVNRIVEGILSNLYMLRPEILVDSMIMAVFLYLLFYGGVDYGACLSSYKKSQFVINMLDRTEPMWIVLRNQLERMSTHHFSISVWQKLRQVLENIDSILTCNQNMIGSNKINWKAISKVSVGGSKLNSYTDWGVGFYSLYNNLYPVQLRASEYFRYLPLETNKVAVSALSSFSLNKMTDVSVDADRSHTTTALPKVYPSEVCIDNCQKMEDGVGRIDSGGAIQLDENKIQTNETDTRPCILLMMSDKQFSDYLQTGLSAYYKITVFDSPNLIMGAVTHDFFDAIIVDEIVNGISGDEICIWIKTHGRIAKIPLVLLVQGEDAESFDSHIKSKANLLESRGIDIDRFRVDVRVIINNYAPQREKVRPFWDSLPDIFIPEKIRNNEDNVLFMETVDQLLAENLLKQKYTVEMLASDVGVCRTKLYNKMKELTGDSPTTYINKFRMRIAAKLLLSKAYNVNEVSSMVGFCDSKYFGKKFREFYHTCPTKYVQQHSDLEDK